MIDKQQKNQILLNFLNEKNNSYADKIKCQLHYYFFELENSTGFLDKLNSKQDIFNKMDLLISKIILLEDIDGFENIVQEYIF